MRPRALASRRSERSRKASSRAAGSERLRRSAPERAAPEPAALDAASVLRLQRLAGNESVSALLAGDRRSPEGALAAVQRHSSWEHMLMGDTPPAELGQAAVSQEARNHVLASEYERIMFFQNDAGADPHGLFSNYRWIQLKASQLWVTYGELNALGDYLPDPTAYDTLDRDTVAPVVQRMRFSILQKLAPAIGLSADQMKDMADHWMPGAPGEVLALDRATASLGTNRYQGLLARNACHFAPMSWERWSHFHATARDEATQHHAGSKAVAPVTYLDATVDEHERQAILNNGYADHFIQDSFAAGHLINKTLVMQYFVDYLNGMNWLSRPWAGMPDDEVMQSMGSAAQPGISGQSLYGHPPPAGETSDYDRERGTDPTDPQSAQERRSLEGRIAGSGVTEGGGRSREENYQAYLRFLNSAFLQAAAGRVHDHFNEIGLKVVNGYGTEMWVGGDDTLLSKSDQVGADTAGKAAQLSRQAIDDILTTGTTAITVEQIWYLVPQWVVVDTKPAPTRASLADWNETVVKQVCFDDVFPDYVDSLAGWVIRMRQSGQMVEGGISGDVGSPVSPPGDYPMPPSDKGYA